MELILLTLFTVKHFVADFLWQTPFMFLNKGKYGHPGGLVHAGVHVLTSAFVLFMFQLFSGIELVWILWALIAEFLIHYHMDWAKIKLNTVKGWKPDTHKEFWWLLGFDQFVHSMTYILMVWMVLHGS